MFSKSLKEAKTRVTSMPEEEQPVVCICVCVLGISWFDWSACLPWCRHCAADCMSFSYSCLPKKLPLSPAGQPSWLRCSLDGIARIFNLTLSLVKACFYQKQSKKFLESVFKLQSCSGWTVALDVLLQMSLFSSKSSRSVKDVVASNGERTHCKQSYGCSVFSDGPPGATDIWYQLCDNKESLQIL